MKPPVCASIGWSIPEEGVEVFLLQPNGKYDNGTKYERGKIPVHIFDGCEIDVAKIFN